MPRHQPCAPARRTASCRGAILLALCLLAGVRAAAQDYYWEAPRPLVDGTGRFPTALSSSNGFIVLWQESEPLAAGAGSAAGGAEGDARQAWLSLSRFSGGAWEMKRRFAGPYEFRGNEPLLYSAASENGHVGIAAAAGDGAIEFLLSKDGGRNFEKAERPAPSAAAVAPRLFPSAAGGWLLFATQGATDSLTMFYTTSRDGSSWSPFAPLVDAADGLSLNFLPSSARAKDAEGRPIDVVVFQSLIAGSRPTFQLFTKISADGGATWSKARRLTDFPDPVVKERNEADAFDNQRPFLAEAAGGLWCSWERRTLSGQTQIYAAAVAPDGSARLPTVDRVSSGAGACSAPAVFELDGQPAVVWFDNRRGGNRVYYAQRRGVDWPEAELSGARGDASFGRVVLSAGKPYAFWQSSEGGRERILVLEPDTSAAPPALVALDFTPGVRTRRESANFRVELAPDSSGIEGYSYLWTRDPAAEPPRRTMNLPNQPRLSFTAPEDGAWYLAVAAVDYAGNWSRAARVRFDRDRTPPPPPLFMPPPADERGFLASNTFDLNWTRPDAEDVAGYTWELRYVGGLERAAGAALPRPAAGARPPLPGLAPYEAVLVERSGPPQPPPVLLGREPKVAYRNIDDGYYLFSVAAIDQTGNIGDAATILLRADKYVPYTAITYADARRDDFGRTSLRLLGRGFTAEGFAERVVIDRDGREPFDLERDRASGGFRVASDREIDGLAFEGLEAGAYRLGVYHPKRGWYWTGALLSVDAAGTLKFGAQAGEYRPSWALVEPRRYRFSLYDAIVAAAVLFSVLGIVLSLRQVAALVRDGQTIRREVLALVQGVPMPSAVIIAETKALGRKGMGLRGKLVGTIIILVLFVVVLLAVPLGVFMTRTQSTNLAKGLEQRALVLLESVAQGGRSYLPAANVLELGFLPQQAKAMRDAAYLTVTGYGADASTEPDAVWATNDPDILARIDGPELRPGSSRLQDGLTPRIASIVEEVNSRAALEVGVINETLAAYTQEGRALATKLDAASQRRLAEIADTSRGLERDLNEKLFALANASVGSEPRFDPAAGLRQGQRYLFYKPILYRRGQDKLYYRGMVRLEVTTDLIAADVRNATTTLVRITLSIAAIALGLGAAGALLLSAIIVKPIRKLESAIKRIRDEPDKEKLGDIEELKDFKRSRSRDEIFTLADTVDQMATGLARAAKASKDLTLGKEIQKMFIPLEVGPRGSKLSTGSLVEKSFEFFGYYEGAKGVSGDYFDFHRLDARYYYFIKCDISGKGVAAALIMVEVATMVITHFEGRDVARKGPELEALCYQINGFIESRGYAGKFAAFTVGIYDADTGVARVCHAGDRLLHIWREAEKRMEILELPDAPTAGTFPNILVEMKTPYKQTPVKLARGDILLLYTDGIEEGKRHFRNEKLEVITCTDVEKDQPHDNHHQGGQDNEEFGYDRVCAILEAVETGGNFRLKKAHDPNDALLTFDFKGCEGTLEDRIMALIAVEKIYRMYPDPHATDNDVILVDQKVDAFLEKHFDQYRLYCGKKRPNSDPDHPEYLLYAGVREDDQYDDLT
ncbi:MAG: SpoIIE family protein phosphatase, partial [Spirochaetaceae bacterium]|nr:SpoIIE family protein phosphatase [Spirochaetaceae bacterium]